MMRRRWSNNGGFTLRMLEESSSEVTSSSAGLVMPSGMAMSPTSLGSPDYADQDLWLYDEQSYAHQNNIITTHNGISTIPAQTTIIPLPSMQTTINQHTPRSDSANSISSGNCFLNQCFCCKPGTQHKIRGNFDV